MPARKSKTPKKTKAKKTPSAKRRASRPKRAASQPKAGVDRFQVMAVLQAARAYELGLSLDAAKSWGLNRAIFYALAKRGYLHRHKAAVKGMSELDRARKRKQGRGLFYEVGGEKAYRYPDSQALRFMMGGKPQTPEQFKRQIERRFDNFEAVWTDALRIVRETDDWNLTRQSRFYANVYKPQRDELAARWSQGRFEQAPSETAAPEKEKAAPRLRLVQGGKRNAA